VVQRGRFYNWNAEVISGLIQRIRGQ